MICLKQALIDQSSRSNVLEHITVERGLRKEVGISFAYYSYQSPETQDLSAIILAVMKQLCRRKENMPPGFLRIKEDSLDPSTIGNKDSFLSLARDFEEIFLIIDALDECVKEKRHRFLAFITIIAESLPNVKIFVTSRREQDISEVFERLSTPTIQIEASSIAADISNYVSNEVQQLREGRSGKKLYLKSDVLEKKIVETLTEKANGM